MVTPTPILPHLGHPADLLETNGDTPRFKTCLKNASVPLALVASDYIYRTVIRHGYDGVAEAEYLPLVTVNVGAQRRKGWVQLPHSGGIPVAVPMRLQAS